MAVMNMSCKHLFWAGGALAACLAGAAEAKPLEKPVEIQMQVMEPAVYRLKVEELPPPRPEERTAVVSRSVPPPVPAVLQAPAGFKVNVFAQGIPRARWMAFTPEGDLLCAASQANVVHLLRDTDKDGVADEIHTFLDKSHGANIPFGMAIHEGHFYVGNTDAVLRYDYKPGQTRIEGEPVKITDLPGYGYNQHWTRNVRVSPEGKLYVTVGSESNNSVEPLPRASVLVMNLDGSDRKVLASGLRNPVGLDFHPQTGEVYVTVNERDNLGHDLVPDYFTRVRQGEFYGWPYVYLAPQNVDRRIGPSQQAAAAEQVATTRTPDVLLAAHSASLGMAFYHQTQFPQRYRGGAFIAFRGSWNRAPATGYKVVFVPFKDGRPTGEYEDFITGFLLDAKTAQTWGRPTGLIAGPDGCVYFTDDTQGRIFRVSYEGKK